MRLSGGAKSTLYAGRIDGGWGFRKSVVYQYSHTREKGGVGVAGIEMVEACRTTQAFELSAVDALHALAFLFRLQNEQELRVLLADESPGLFLFFSFFFSSPFFFFFFLVSS